MEYTHPSDAADSKWVFSLAMTSHNRKPMMSKGLIQMKSRLAKHLAHDTQNKNTVRISLILQLPTTFKPISVPKTKRRPNSSTEMRS